MRGRLNVRLLIASLLACALAGCEGGIGGTGGVAPPNAVDGSVGTIETTGHAAKGPFGPDSAVRYTVLSNDGTRGATRDLSATGSLGEFAGALPSGASEMTVSGLYISENLGGLSTIPLTLRSIWSGAGTANINVLGHITSDRTLVLMSEGMGVLNAQSMAMAELIESLRPILTAPDTPVFVSEVSVLRQFGSNPEADAYLLAVSAILERYALDQTTSDTAATQFLSLLIDGWADDLSSDGVLNLDGELAGLTVARSALRPDQIYTNLLQTNLRVTDDAEAGLGLVGDFSCEAIEGELTCVELSADAATEPANDVLTVPLTDLLPDIERFLDTDGDGTANDLDTDDDDDGVPDADDGDRFDPSLD
ncbi:MAG: hypothetical protein AAF525_08465 [Pseudomonadota bacterium]